MLIAILTVVLLLAEWLIWLLSKPGRHILVDEEDSAKMDACMPEEVTQGNHIDTYVDFHPMAKQLMSDIEAAQQFIHVQFFKFEADAVGQSIGNALVKKAKEGVEVRLMYDYLTNLKSRWYYKKLRKEGVQVCGFGWVPLPLIRKKDNYRNHRKVVVIDGRVGYAGGMNIADRYYKGLSWGKWRDTQIRVEGPAVAQLQRAFLSDWRYAAGQLLAHPRYFPAVEPKGEVPVKIVTSGPIGEGPVIMEQFCQMLDQSKRYAYWESPYFIPPRPIMQAVCNAAKRGVDVRIIIPPRGDNGIFTPLASQAYLQTALDAGVKFYMYKDGYMHSKFLVSDDSLVSIGSTNIDPRSFFLDLEVNALIESAQYAQEIKNIFQTDEKRSNRVKAEEWRKRPVVRKVLERIARVISAQL